MAYPIYPNTSRLLCWRRLYFWLLILSLWLFIGAGSAFAQAGATASCPSGLVHYFGLDETTGGTYADYASAATATCATCPSPAEGLFAGAQAFKGKNPAISLSSIENFEWGPNSSFTIELWMKSSGSASGNQVFIGRDAKDSNMMWWLGMNDDGHAVFDLYDRTRTGFSTVGEGVKIDDGNWHHIAIVRDGRLRLNKLYVDGYAVARFEFNYQDNFESTSPVNIGFMDLNKGYAYNGLLDELMVYNRDLSETEVRARYNNGSGSYCGPQTVLPQIMSEAVTHGVVGQQYRYEVQAVGQPAPTFALTEAPAGMSIDASSGNITWTPTATGSYPVTVTVTNSAGSDQQEFTIVVKQEIGEPAGMLHHWMLHEIRGPVYHDYYTPYHATGSDNTLPMATTGVVSGGQQFDGEDDGLNVEESYNFDWNADESFSIELWLRSGAGTAGNRVLIGRDAKDSEAHWWVGLDAEGRAGFQLLDIEWDGIYVGGSGARLNDDQWHQVVAVRNGGSGLTELYVDGQKVASGNHTYTYGFASRSAVNIGYLNDGEGYHYQGILDEVKLFGRVLSAEEIKERYENVYEAITELVRFEGEFANGGVLLTWETMAEAGLSHFEVERAPDTEQFEKLGDVAAAGNSNTPLVYNFTDIDPLPEAGYYRLKIVKEDGKYTYSNIIKVENKSLTSTYFRVYPNPINTGDVTAELRGLPPGEEVQFYVADLRGLRLVDRQEKVDEFGQLQLQLPITTAYRPGIYVLTIVSSKRIVSRKLVVNR
ncbi:LamG-like jellyroll fold domain-containing protein [Pontibacter mangrovi]|uniref:T9SS type A sorting domain-containing protein n=1 Tax=Pontibacter mangrovi TaxID=2589816 RepID=A0A501W4M4_9BACT|nr:LamG-like jellyroll fold domain-containing protein [Pontibacter mangrovi]TPE43064.1 T9SS type A sorting domain-containing protein [Pontibacter mangrovi]